MTHHAPLIIDIAGLSLEKKDGQRLQNPVVGGLVLFARNWQNRHQLTALCRSIKQLRADLLICVDHEGGRVQRFKTDGFTHLPPMRDIGKLGQGVDGVLRATRLATACGYVLGAELRACGVDLSFTPVLDLDYGVSDVIGDRAFDADALHVVLLAQSLMHGLLMNGMLNCGKHFPGHGFVSADSHTDIPVDHRTLEAIATTDMTPYRWLGMVLTSVMPAHIIYPQVDSRPAGFSERWLRDILRGLLDFTGAIFSDDLSMAGARMIDGQAVNTTQAAVAALKAGCDMVLLCNQSIGDGEELDELIHGLTEAQRQGLWLPCNASEERRCRLLPARPATPWDMLMEQPHYQHARRLLS